MKNYYNALYAKRKAIQEAQDESEPVPKKMKPNNLVTMDFILKR